MAHVITDVCVGTCDTACVDVCPVDCIAGPLTIDEIRGTPDAALAERFPRLQLYIDPEACICCAACVPVCPVAAIFDEDDLPPEHAASRAENAAFFAEMPPRMSLR